MSLQNRSGRKQERFTVAYVKGEFGQTQYILQLVTSGLIREFPQEVQFKLVLGFGHTFTDLKCTKTINLRNAVKMWMFFYHSLSALHLK